jgi:hypothetical protein
MSRTDVVLPGGRTAIVVFAPADVSGEDAVAALGLGPPRGLVVLNGSTNELPPKVSADLRASLGDGLARVAIDEALTVVTGGTDAGIFAIFGQALGDERPVACVGVAPAGLVTWPGREARAGCETAALEPHHTHFLLVDGDEWGVETDAMVALAATLAETCPSILVVAGGGAGAKREVLAQVRLGREVVVLAGSGRLADELAAAVAGGDPADAETAEATESGLVTVLGRDGAPAALASLLRARLKPTGEERPG